jgi:glucose 1-dehydrogenase
MQLHGKTAIVTGAASAIGRAIAQAFAAEGANVVIADIRADPIGGGRPTAELIVEAGGTALYQETDVARWDDIDRVVSLAVARFGRLDVMVNNVAIAPDGPLLETTEEQWERTFAVNLKGVFFGCKRAVQQMLTQDPVAEARGRLINISSQHGMIASPGYIAYGTSKAGVAYMTRQIAADYAKEGIVCNAIAPGKIETGTAAEEHETWRMEIARARTPMARLGRPQDIANAAVFLASDRATFITGVNLMVDGGWMAA